MAGASCAADQLDGLRRLGEAHGDRKVVGGGAIPLAPTRLTNLTGGDAGAEGLEAPPPPVPLPPIEEDEVRLVAWMAVIPARDAWA